MRRIPAVMIILVLAGAAAGEDAAPAKAPAKTFVAVFDFAGHLGPDVADRIRLRLRRHAEYTVIDRFTIKDFADEMPATTKVKNIVELMDEEMGAHVAVYGTVTQRGATVTAVVGCIDRTNPEKQVQWTKTFSDSTQRARPLIARWTVEKFRGRPEWVPPQYGDEAEPAKFGKPVNPNGDFEKGYTHWDRPDNVSTFIVDGPPGRGKILRIRTDLKRGPWLAYRKALRSGRANPSRPPKIARDTSYGSVAGLEGVHYRGAWLKATAGRRYWLVADHKGQGGAKVFVKGFIDWSARADGLPASSLVKLGITPRQWADMPAKKRRALIAADARQNPELYRREVYRWYLNCKEGKGRWKHIAAPFPPRGGLPVNVQWLQVQIYSYWPPGEYLWDNVRLYEDPRQTAPVAEEKARTPNLGRTSDVVDEEIRQREQRREEKD